MAFSVAAAIAAARSKIGAPYVWGATGPASFDCSGLTQWAWGKAGVKLPRTSQAQASFGTAVPVAKIRAGDLVTSDWSPGRNKPSSHVGLYIGSGHIIHAPRPGKPVTIAKMDANYRAHINAIRRVPNSVTTGVTDAGWNPGDLLGGIPGLAGDAGDVLGDLGDVLFGKGGILGPLASMARETAGIAGSLASVGGFATLLLKLALPTTWVRIAAGFLGAMFLFLGLAFLIKETRSAA